MVDIDGNEVKAGDVVEVLYIYPEFLDTLDDDMKTLHKDMLGRQYPITELVEDGTKASIDMEWTTDEGVIFGGLYMIPSDFRLVCKNSR
ncbi:putative integron gene cassette protein [Vibrio nigripulchritudo MADA3029]|uniref:hypothetical protein n=1 Tax=Vibrio nigripulchritudo TaxID=28173 RepID=UPI00021C0D3A|nr:hypothetical protein [Vibrio nigripulchritudo]EGU61852.1 hypothetical protein VINI7043_28560 [Vibrio nigripulchritudo ATCC 27043]CCN45439.1 putative integron gene cassette protein [Vibrio nigripulchritudo MADA3020]CCN53369.1 putative integron gene cassette protein [Vibrio nigripulchritudo MADA3021]CCN58567.1 putative integron gene cassette protein [Vibrio nigripulchritudo MADA3029]